MSGPVCDLILLSWNHLELTQPCLETLFRHTTVPCRLIIVDNASEPPVRRFLERVTPQGAIVEVTLLQNERNEGFSRGMNRGIRDTRAPYVVLLNNDLRFAPHWLEEMLAVAQADPSIGVVNPESNTFGHLPPKGMPLERYAEQLVARHGEYTEVGMCIGFCMLVTRPVIDRIGGLTEEVERFFFEDEDYCERAREAGFRCVTAAASYVYHAEHQSVKHLPDREALFARNQQWCNNKWGKRIRIAWPRLAPAVPGSSELKQWLVQLLSWVRRRTHVYVYCPTPAGTTMKMLFRSVGLAPHADIHWYPVTHLMPGWEATGRILARRKKRFDVIVAPTPGWQRRLSWLTWCHGAAVVPEDDEERLTQCWRRRAYPVAAAPHVGGGA